jgi:hypothetical protein
MQIPNTWQYDKPVFFFLQMQNFDEQNPYVITLCGLSDNTVTIKIKTTEW